jgi:hypothetical protein
MKTFAFPKFVAAAALLCGFLAKSSTSEACGGFFCSAQQPVNQAAERIIFAQNGDGTVTAVIQILYQGPSENFSWLLPISTVVQEGDIGIASDLAFQRLQARTNPQYNLTTRLEGQCDGQSLGSGGAAANPGAPTTSSGGSTSSNDGGVTVESSGVIGQFEWTVISFDASLEDPADAAVVWLEANGYDVSPGSPELIAPYLEDGMYLLALKLQKGSDSGSIRPISLTYDADLPMIPIKLTAVAANDDMGVMTWILGEDRAVPRNYYSLELNEARINWFNAASNYNDVVSEAADEAGGQGFVTEFAGATTALDQAVWSDAEDAQFTTLRGNVYNSFTQLFQTMTSVYSGYDGYWDAVRSTVVLPDGVPFEDFRSCPTCYESQIEFSPSAFFSALETSVIKPMRDVQELIDDLPYVTRLYSTMSAEEMTVDPLFTFNADLDELSNIHSAERVIECSPGFTQFSAPWRIELPQGGVIRGSGQDAQSRSWPATTAEQPSNRRIVQLGESGDGMVAEDNTKLLADLNGGKVAGGAPGSGGAAAGSGGAGATPGGGTGGTPSGVGMGGGGPRPSGGAAPTGGTSAAPTTGGSTAETKEADLDGEGCSVRPGRSNQGGLTALLALITLGGLLRRRRS